MTSRDETVARDINRILRECPHTEAIAYVRAAMRCVRYDGWCDDYTAGLAKALKEELAAVPTDWSRLVADSADVIVTADKYRDAKPFGGALSEDAT